MKSKKKTTVKGENDISKVEEKNQGKQESTISEEMVPKSQLARALADYDNLRKRVEQERSYIVRFASQEIVGKLLPVLDIIETAQKHLNDQGLSVAVAEFKKVLIEQGLIEIMPEKGQSFDHDLHEAVEVADGENGKIIEVLQSGWKFKEGNVLRHAKVKVGQTINN